jgi:hypothetical protein
MAAKKNRRTLTQEKRLEIIGFQLLQVSKDVEKLNQAVDDMGKVLLMQTAYGEAVHVTLKKFFAYLTSQSVEPAAQIQ